MVYPQVVAAQTHLEVKTINHIFVKEDFLMPPSLPPSFGRTKLRSFFSPNLKKIFCRVLLAHLCIFKNIIFSRWMHEGFILYVLSGYVVAENVLVLGKLNRYF